jgi:hypothetical protein
MPMRVIAKKRCRAMVEPPEKGERATLNPNLSTKLNLLFSDQALGRRVGYCWSRKASGAVSPFFEVLAGTALGPAFFLFRILMASALFGSRPNSPISTEMALHVLAYNMKRVMSILGVGGLMEAMKTPGRLSRSSQA